MSRKVFIKILSANDIGATGGHQAGIVVPKSNGELLSFLPLLNSEVLNPSAWIECLLPDGSCKKVRFVYYNNRFHSPAGTRNEYRLTHLTKVLRDMNAKIGDSFEISKADNVNHYRIRVISNGDRAAQESIDPATRIRLLTGWHRLH